MERVHEYGIEVRSSAPGQVATVMASFSLTHFFLPPFVPPFPPSLLPSLPPSLPPSLHRTEMMRIQFLCLKETLVRAREHHLHNLLMIAGRGREVREGGREREGREGGKEEGGREGGREKGGSEGGRRE